MELVFIREIISQIIIPKDNYSYFRCISGYVDSTSNIAIGSLKFKDINTIIANVPKQINENQIYVKLIGIK